MLYREASFADARIEEAFGIGVQRVRPEQLSRARQMLLNHLARALGRTANPRSAVLPGHKPQMPVLDPLRVEELEPAGPVGDRAAALAGHRSTRSHDTSYRCGQPP